MFTHRQVNVLCLTVQSSIRHLFGYSFEVKDLSFDRWIGPYLVLSHLARVDLGSFIPHSPKLHDWSLTIILFNIISWTLLGCLAPLKGCSRCILQAQATRQGKWVWKWYQLKLARLEQSPTIGKRTGKGQNWMTNWGYQYYMV